MPQVSFYFTLENGTAVVDFRAWGMWLAMKVKTTTGGLILCKDGDCSEDFCIDDSNCAEGYHCCKSDFTFKCGKIFRPGFLAKNGSRTVSNGGFWKYKFLPVQIFVVNGY